jgi:Tol biopolymer transport system component
MALLAGTRLGPYEVTAPLGAGGMGEVYRAKDTKLDRTVAVKVLPSHLAADREALGRFEREAKAVAALSHPNILAIHDFGAHDGTTYAVMELLEGQTLRERLGVGPVPLRKAIDYAIQIARGLAAANEKGIVHRDVKPENLFVTQDGRVKILDFGLARQASSVFKEDDTNSPTPSHPDDHGALLGTVGYISPEQVRGQTADHRSDIFALGVVLYELVSGRRAFKRASVVETLNAILTEEPPELAGEGVVRDLDRVVRHCLEKNPAERFQSARDLAFDLESLTGSSGSGRSALAAVGYRPRVAPFVTGLLLGVLLTGGVSMWLSRSQASVAPPTIRPLTFSGRDIDANASPDGRVVAFVSRRDGRPRVWVKQLGGGDEVALTAGPDDAPRFSPDGASILFARSEEGGWSLYVVGALGGEPRRVVKDAAEGDWSPDGKQIAFLRSSRESGPVWAALFVADVDGAHEREVARVADATFTSPRWSPDAKVVAVFQGWAGNAGVTPSLLTYDLATGERRVVSSVGAALAWSGKSELLSAQMASSSFNAASRLVAHDAVSGKARTLFSSPNSILGVDVVGPGQVVLDTVTLRQNINELRLIDKDKGHQGAGRWLTRGSSSDRQPVYAPDGEWVAFSSDRGSLDLWAVSTKTGATRQLTHDAADDWDPSFTPDGAKLVWSSNRSGNFEIWMAESDGSSPRQVSHDGVDAQNPSATPDGRWILYATANPRSLGIWKVHPDGSGATLLSKGSKGIPEVAPDGRHALYVETSSDQRFAVIHVVRIEDGVDLPFEIRLASRQAVVGITLGRARWMPDGKAIAFTAPDETGASGVFVQDFDPGKDTVATRRRLGGFLGDQIAESFGISPDGTRITVAYSEAISNLQLVEGLPGVLPSRRSGR